MSTRRVRACRKKTIQKNDELETEPAHLPSLKLEDDSVESISQFHSDHDTEEKEASSTTSSLSYCRGLSKTPSSKTPLSVPMVTDTNHHNSMTRNDAKAITQTRLKRLKELSKRPEQTLSKHQKDEKKRIIRLEKNRRAAAMSRRKKKMYVKNLEEKTQLMARHLAILEMENAHLRAILQSAQQQQPAQQQSNNVMNFSAFKVPQFQVPNMSHFNHHDRNSDVAHRSNTESTTSSSAKHSLEPVLNETRCTKRRKLNDGSAVNIDTPSLSCDNCSDVSILEPLPLPMQCSEDDQDKDKNKNKNKKSNNDMLLPPPPPLPLNLSPMPGLLGVGQPVFVNPTHLNPHTHLLPPIPSGFMRYNHHNINMNVAINNRDKLKATDVLPKIDTIDGLDTIEAIVIDKDNEDADQDNKCAKGQKMEKMEKNTDLNDLPPAVVSSSCNDFLSYANSDNESMNLSLSQYDDWKSM